MERPPLPLLFALLLGCAAPPPTPPPAVVASVTKAPAPARPARPKSDSEKTVLDVALGSPDHSTLVAAVTAAGKADALGSPGGIYTVFAPTNAAFDKLPAGTVDALLTPEKKGDLTAIVQHHAAVPIVHVKDMKDGQVMGMADGTSVTLREKDGTWTVDGATIVASVVAMNGVVHVIDTVLLPPAK